MSNLIVGWRGFTFELNEDDTQQVGVASEMLPTEAGEALKKVGNLALGVATVAAIARRG